MNENFATRDQFLKNTNLHDLCLGDIGGTI